jgi:uncharacterized protein
MRTLAIVVGCLAVALIGGFFAIRVYAISTAEKQLMTPYKNGTATPADFGVAYTPFWIDSNGRKLQASLVVAPSSCPDRVAVLLFHGRGETVSSWAKAQAFLSGQCVSSIVFDYSGFGNSTPPSHIETLNTDAIAAYHAFVGKFSGNWRRCVLGHSLGNAPMMHVYPSYDPKPDCVVMTNAFSSVEDMALAGGAPVPLAAFLHGVWDNMQAVKAVSGPLMIVHSDHDETIPMKVADHLYDAAPVQARRVRLHGFDHNRIFREPGLDWWKPVLAFLHGKS